MFILSDSKTILISKYYRLQFYIYFLKLFFILTDIWSTFLQTKEWISRPYQSTEWIHFYYITYLDYANHSSGLVSDISFLNCIHYETKLVIIYDTKLFVCQWLRCQGLAGISNVCQVYIILYLLFYKLLKLLNK